MRDTNITLNIRMDPLFTAAGGSFNQKNNITINSNVGLR